MQTTMPAPPSQNHFPNSPVGPAHIVPQISTQIPIQLRKSREATLIRKEDVIREELNNLAERGHRHYHFSLKALGTVSAALFFLRKHAADHAGLIVGEPFPFGYHLWGTLALAVAALILTLIAATIYSSYAHFARQLPPTLSCGVAWVPRKKVKWIILLSLWLFPCFDAYLGWSNVCSPLRHNPAYHTPGPSFELVGNGGLAVKAVTKSNDTRKPAKPRVVPASARASSGRKHK